MLALPRVSLYFFDIVHLFYLNLYLMPYFQFYCPFLSYICDSLVLSPYSGLPGKVLPKVTTLPVDISHGDKLESSSSSSKFKLERSKTERQRHLRPEDAAQIFDDKIPVQEKVYYCDL